MIFLQFNKKPPNNYKIEENLKKTAALAVYKPKSIVSLIQVKLAI